MESNGFLTPDMLHRETILNCSQFYDSRIITFIVESNSFLTANAVNREIIIEFSHLAVKIQLNDSDFVYLLR